MYKLDLGDKEIRMVHVVVMQYHHTVMEFLDGDESNNNVNLKLIQNEAIYKL